MPSNNECLICCTPVDRDNWTQLLVNNQITAYFIISKLFEISQSKVIQWLQNGNHPSDWISFCKRCFKTVIEAKKIFTQLVKLEAQWKQAKLDVEKNLCKNYNPNINNSDSDVTISYVIRQETVKRLEFSSDIEIEVFKRELSGNNNGVNVKCDLNEITNESDCKSYSELWFPHMEAEDAKEKVPSLKNKVKNTRTIKHSTKIRLSNLKKKARTGRKKTQKTATVKKKRPASLQLVTKEESNAPEGPIQRSRSGRTIKAVKYNVDIENESENEIGNSLLEGDDMDIEGESDFSPDPDMLSDNEDEDPAYEVEPTSRNKTSKNIDSEELCCKYCSKTFRTLKVVEIHEIRKHRNKHKCQECVKEYSTFDDLAAHIDVYHTPEENRTNKKPFECSECGSFFRSERYLGFHTNKVHKGVKQAYVCECGKAFELEKNLRRHEVSIHNDHLPFRCTRPRCRFATTTDNKLQRHILLIHDSKAPVICPECNKELKSEYHLRKHLETIHDTRRNFVCELCSAAFKQMASLKFHQMGHHNIVFEELESYSVKCEHCDKVLSNPHVLRRHILSVHEKKYLYHCPICNTGFQTKDKVDKHIIIAHSDKRPFACTYCDKSYISKGKLEVHVRTHTGEKPFECNICQKTFSCKKYLEAHEKIHTNEKNFQCDMCPKRFPIYQYLSHHKWYVHRRQKSQMPPKQLVDETLLEALASSGGYKKSQTLFSNPTTNSTETENSNSKQINSITPPIITE